MQNVKHANYITKGSIYLAAPVTQVTYCGEGGKYFYVYTVYSPKTTVYYRNIICVCVWEQHWKPDP